MNNQNPLAGGTMKTNDNTELQTARDKLNRLVDQALENGTSITETHEIMEQCRKIDEMITQCERAEIEDE